MSAPELGPLLAALATVSIAPQHDGQDVVREAVYLYVGQCKRAGLSPEDITIAVKNAAGVTRPAVDPSLMAQVIDWCVERYFKPD
jgi:hypothetical protein